ncbi:fumarylacetoacetate hydrolase family protein [Amphiplicatus metriothermophilus]|uniref:Fumarylpyruvate hydrolase n=1 Tax=Amphiplicatus metriothermophilus TaxID=1519374 RepID=A0A239PXZ8_9PROT|nr:fumarylacetoacetate hydrolase family protein [Amphiplicatus metriothermophilus]MBB5519931.1 fumarylpyruvate hydrolase [Amphiplicatus metriothermophilus]SNT74832.1 fumarylpyruvate hydrolase [Amphiplicatus metriothermophilus]
MTGGREGVQGFVIDPPAVPSVPVEGGGRFPVRRIFCVGKNYAEHVREMGADPRESPPVFFAKPADAVVESGATIPYPPGTDNLHYEGELVLALRAGGRDIASVEEADKLVFGFAAGCDLTRRDLQAAAKHAGAPWDAAKAFDRSAPVGAVARKEDRPLGEDARLVLSVNGEVRQAAALSEMIWSPAEILMALSRLFELKPGDLVFTGTPAGVGPLYPADEVEVRVGALPALGFSIAGGD